MRQPPVMADVARLAGVSHQTVSRVVNGHPHIRPATRTRVEDAIAALGYRPNGVARALAVRRSGTIGVVSTDTALHGPATVQRSVEEAAARAGYVATTVTIREATTDELGRALDRLVRATVEGIVLVAGSDAALTLARGADFPVPLVVAQGDLTATGSAVGVDQLQGARAAARHLVELGHTRIAHVSGPLGWPEARARREGWLGELAAAGLDAGPEIEGDWTPASGYAAGLALAPADVTAVFVANDHMAVGLVRALVEAGRDVPRNVSVVGFDDIPEAAYLLPPLTTVRQDFATVGRRAIEVLHGMLTGVPDPGPRLTTPVLVPRSSTAAPSTAVRVAS
ncbi:LacI family DNA-binding transcriptional regulator [Pseudonocardia broussonetiae]|nr:LacI family DNA-binding transcriptional regulator [Pseudonocardia broussonetiae]